MAAENVTRGLLPAVVSEKQGKLNLNYHVSLSLDESEYGVDLEIIMKRKGSLALVHIVPTALLVLVSWVRVFDIIMNRSEKSNT